MEIDENKVYTSLHPDSENKTCYDIDLDYFGLGKLIARLEQTDRDKLLSLGFWNPHSYRGYYEQLAFEPIRNITVGQMLVDAKAALGKEFQGYKGGWFKMDEGTYIWIAYIGSGGGQQIGSILMDFMLGESLRGT